MSKEKKSMDLTKVMNQIGEDSSRKLSSDLIKKISLIEKQVKYLSDDLEGILDDHYLTTEEILKIMLERTDFRKNVVGYEFNERQKEILLYKSVLGESIALELDSRFPHQKENLDQDIFTGVMEDVEKILNKRRTYDEHRELFIEFRNALYDKRYKEKNT